MYKHLYDSFSRWYHGGQIYIYSDPHFSDEEMKYIRRDYIDDEEQVKRINSVLGQNDTIIFLGDIGDVEPIKKIKGYKVLIKGNHDSGTNNYKRVTAEEKYPFKSDKEKMDEIYRSFAPIDSPAIHYTACEAQMAYAESIIREDFKKQNLPDRVLMMKKRDIEQRILTSYKDAPTEQWYYHVQYDNHLFDEVYEGPLFISDRTLLSHEPIDFPYALNIHGHDHANKEMVDDRHFNVCAENIGYTPICLKHIIEAGKLKNIETIHEKTINYATERKIKRDEMGN